jgi:hypothetical protein
MLFGSDTNALSESCKGELCGYSRHDTLQDNFPQMMQRFSTGQSVANYGHRSGGVDVYGTWLS